MLASCTRNPSCVTGRRIELRAKFADVSCGVNEVRKHAGLKPETFNRFHAVTRAMIAKFRNFKSVGNLFAIKRRKQRLHFCWKFM